MSMFHKQQENNDIFSYTQYLKLKKQKELKQIHKIKCKNEKKDTKKRITDKVQQKTEKICSNLLKSVANLKQQDKSKKTNWNKVDQKAIIVNGKLVYMEEQKPSLQDSDQLIRVLRNNNIKIKQFIYGDKQKILSKIDKNHENKKNEEVERYINKNMREENVIKTNHSNWYQVNKQNLFNCK